MGTDLRRCYIARSALTLFLLEVAQTIEPGIRGIALEFVPTSSTGCNWHVASIDYGGADPRSAQAAVARAVRGNSAWTLVEDGDEHDGRRASSDESE